jgi:hypothetical protein
MSDQEKKECKCFVKSYLGFIDNNVLFKKPISCLYAIVSLLIPVYALSQFIQFGVFKSAEANVIIAGVLILLVLAFAGIVGACIWWFRRITRDEGPKLYSNFRRFIQTAGEWSGTVFAISVFGAIIILMIFLQNEYFFITRAIPFPIPGVDIVTALYGPIGGFIIIIITKIMLFLLDPIVWLIKKIWNLIKRIVLYCYRFIASFCGTLEKNNPFWVGATWVLAVAVIIAAVVLCFLFRGFAPAFALAAGLAFMGYLMFKRKHYDV